MSLHEIFEDGYAKAITKYGDEQDQFLSIVAEARNMPVEAIKKARGIFIPNDEFMMELFGPEICAYDCYHGDSGLCNWSNAVIFPIRNVNNKVTAFAGFFPFDYVDTEIEKNYYAYSSQKVFQKGRYLYFPIGNLEDAINDGYLIVVDGLFDSISLCNVGFHAASFMGSSLTPEILMQLRFVNQIIVPADNDSAGYSLYEKLKRKLPNVTLFRQGKTKDIDDLLKSDYADNAIAELQKIICRQTSKTSVL